MDFNISTHLPSEVFGTSFLTENLETVIDRLNAQGLPFDGPKNAHPGMTTIEFRAPDGYLIKVNQPGDGSPSWLTV
jgi:catechol 2,3-dioxygenase-like lactoylglutathione lyase family enzyme